MSSEEASQIGGFIIYSVSQFPQQGVLAYTMLNMWATEDHSYFW